MTQDEVYILKASLKDRKRIWRRIEIKGNQTLRDFDDVLREAFKHDYEDHLSGFFSGDAWKSKQLGVIEPYGGGTNSKKKISKLDLLEGTTIEYVYDFGDNIQHVIKLEKIVDSIPGTNYPRITSQNKPKYQYCVACEKIQKNSVATWICIECSSEKQENVLLCDDCLDEEHPDHYAEELLF